MVKKMINKKVIISGDIVEVYDYEDGLIIGRTSRGGRLSGCNSSDNDKNREVTLQRARRELIRIVNANFGAYGKYFSAKFLTLTFREDIKDLRQANDEFRKFIKRLNYKLFKTKSGNIRYTAVPEFTKKGRVHYHVILYNLPYVNSRVFEQVWRNGFIKINKINNVDNVGAYIAKYMSKAYNDKRMIGQKCYFNSRGLFKPLEITDKEKAETIIQSLPSDKIVFETRFENQYCGGVLYKQYNLKRTKK